MTIIINAVFPTIVLLVLGNILRRRGFVAADFWAAADKLTYFVLFPALLVSKVSQVDLSIVNFTQLFIFIPAYLSALSLLAWLIYRYFGTKENQFSSIYQGSLRFNTYIYFAIVEPVWGQSALSLAALLAGFIIPALNVCCVASFSVGSGKFSLKNTLLSIVKNPLILAALLGFVVNQFPVLMPQVILNSLSILSKAALPLALLSVGAAIQIKMLWKKHEGFTRQALWSTTLLGLLGAPLIAYTIVSVLGVSTELSNMLVMYAAVPTATSSYILAKQLGGHAEMMATIVSLQTVCSMLSLTAWLFILT